MPRLGARALHRSGRRQGTVGFGWILALVAMAVFGWSQMRKYEARVHLLHRSSEAESRQQATGSGGRPQSTSHLCVAHLSDAGVLPKLSLSTTDGSSSEDADVLGTEGRAGGSAAVLYLRSRRRLYEAMEASLLNKGLALASVSTQGMGLSDLFTLEEGKLKPVLTALAVPVRAIVMPLTDAQAASKLAAAVQQHLAPLVPANGMWPQDRNLFHSTIFHASTHLDPVPAGAGEVAAEAAAIAEVGRRACPLHVVLERVVATAGGTVLACWQVVKGTDPFDLRQQLAAALPKASRQQIVQDRSILHTTLSRLVTVPRLGSGHGGEAAEGSGSEGAAVLQRAVDEMTRELCGLRAVMDQLWFAEESDKLALALGGHFTHRVVPLQCTASDQ